MLHTHTHAHVQIDSWFRLPYLKIKNMMNGFKCAFSMIRTFIYTLSPVFLFSLLILWVCRRVLLPVKMITFFFSLSLVAILLVYAKHLLYSTLFSSITCHYGVRYASYVCLAIYANYIILFQSVQILFVVVRWAPFPFIPFYSLTCEF